MSPPNTTYFVNPKLAAPRAYWNMVDVIVNPGVAVSWTGGAWYFSEFVNAGFQETWLVPDPRFYAWSSNNWTLDFLFSDQYSILNHSGVHFHNAMQVGVGLNVSNMRWGALAVWSVGNVNHFFDLPDATAPYWVPPLPV